MGRSTGKKGVGAEEALRYYFKEAGYFVVRGIPLTYKTFDVTDVDLWLYGKTPDFSSERVCVDIKRRRTPQAMERVLWTKGLREVLKVDRAIVVTSDKRLETRDFGTAHGVKILQGDFLQRAISQYSTTGRLTEEELLSLIKEPCLIKPGIEWRSWYRHIKGRLLDRLNFDGSNIFLLAAKLLLDEYLAAGKTSEVPLRLLYNVVAYFLISIDFRMRSFFHLDSPVRTAVLTDGFRYGEVGKKRTEEIVKMALQLLSEAGKTTLFSGDDLHSEFDKQVSEYRAEILGEYFGKMESLKNLFPLACSFEEHAFSKSLVLPHEFPSELKAIIGLICDFLEKDRKTVI